MASVVVDRELVVAGLRSPIVVKTSIPASSDMVPVLSSQLQESRQQKVC